MISMTALDIYEEDYGMLKLDTVLFIHLLPTIFLFFSLVIAWKNEKIGSIFYTILALITIILFRTYVSLNGLLIISVPLIMIALLFFIGSKRKKTNMEIVKIKTKHFFRKTFRKFLK